MAVFEYSDYKRFILSTLQKMPKEGYGQFKKMAEHLEVNSVIISQVFNGPRDLNSEQAVDLAAYFGLNAAETEYFVLLVQKARAGTVRLARHLQKRLDELKEQSKNLKTRLPQDQTLSEEAKAMFYSNWYFSGIRLLTSVPGYNDVDSIAEYFQLPRAIVKHAIDFLLQHGLCVEEKGKIKMGPKLTHLEAASPLVTRHHSNWRLRAMNKSGLLAKDEIMYSGPMSLSQEDMEWVRARIVDLLEEVVQRVKKSDSERVACLNIDWFDIRSASR